MTHHRAFVSLLAALIGLGSGIVAADPGYYLVTPYSTPGQAAVDLRYWSVKSPEYGSTQWPEIGLRYGVDSRWTTELRASYVGNSLREQRLSSLNWQNTYLLTQGQYPFDLALQAQLIRNRGAGNALELGPVLQTEWGRTQLNLNLIFEKDGAAGEGTTLKYQWQALRRLAPGLRLGLQGFGEQGHGEDAASHRIGPVLRVTLFDRAELQAAYLWGKTYGERGDMFSAQLLLPF